MPVNHLVGRYRELELGKVVRGYKKEVVDRETGKVRMKKGKAVTMPVATDYYIFKEKVPGAAEEVIEMLGTDEPRTLPIRVLGNRPEDVFPQFCELFRGDRLMRCKGTGGSNDHPGMVVFRRGMRKLPDGKMLDEVVIKKQPVAYLPEPDVAAALEHYAEIWQKEYGVAEILNGQNTVACLGEDCPKYDIKGCRPTGHLKFTIQGLERSGHWRLDVHTLAIMAFNYQLEKMMEFIEPYVGRRLNLVPFVLSMGPKERIKIDDMYVPYYDPHLEVDPRWLRAVLQGQITLPIAPRITKADIWGERAPLAIQGPAQEEIEAEAVEPMLPPDYIDPEQEALDYEPWPDDMSPDEPAEDDLQADIKHAMEAAMEDVIEAAVDEAIEHEPGIIAADSFKRWLVGTVDNRMTSLATEPQVGYVASMMGSVFGTGQQANVARHQVLEYVFGVKSTKELTKGQAHALIDWLKTGEGRTFDGGWEPSPGVVDQANALLRAWGEEHGQQRLL